MVDQHPVEPSNSVDPSAIFDLGASIYSDVASDKDRMVGEAIGVAKRFRHARTCPNSS